MNPNPYEASAHEDDEILEGVTILPEPPPPAIITPPSDVPVGGPLGGSRAGPSLPSLQPALDRLPWEIRKKGLLAEQLIQESIRETTPPFDCGERLAAMRAGQRPAPPLSKPKPKAWKAPDGLRVNSHTDRSRLPAPDFGNSQFLERRISKPHAGAHGKFGKYLRDSGNGDLLGDDNGIPISTNNLNFSPEEEARFAELRTLYDSDIPLERAHIFRRAIRYFLKTFPSPEAYLAAFPRPETPYRLAARTIKRKARTTARTSDT